MDYVNVFVDLFVGLVRVCVMIGCGDSEFWGCFRIVVRFAFRVYFVGFDYMFD